MGFGTGVEGLRRFSEWYTELEFRDIPEDVIELSKIEVANQVAAVYSSLAVDDSTHGEFDRGGEGYRVVGDGWSDRFSSYYLNSLRSMRYDYDDYLFMGHSGHSAVFGSLVFAPSHGSGERFLKDVVAVNELAGRIGAATAIGPYNGQMWSYIHAAGCAAVAALHRAGDPDSIADAVSLALSQPSTPVREGFLAGDGKIQTASISGVLGLRSGFLAGDGFRTDREVFDEFLDEKSFLALPETLSGYGESWVTRTLSFKPYPGCAYLQSPIELVDRNPVQGKVRFEVSAVTIEMDSVSERWLDGDSPVAVGFSLPYSTAAFRSGGIDTTSVSRGYLERNRRKIERIAEKTEVKHSWKHTYNVAEGLTDEFPVMVLIANRNPTSVAQGIKKLTSCYGVSARKLLMTGCYRDSVRKILTEDVDRGGFVSATEIFGDVAEIINPLSAKSFEFGEIDFDEIEFRFGATMKSGGETFELESHRGSCCDTVEERKRIVREKFVEEYSKLSEDAEETWEILMNIEEEEIGEVVNSL